MPSWNLPWAYQPRPVKGSVLDNAAFRRWFGDSVVRNPDGTPKVVYHGTKASFTAFRRPSKAQQGFDRFGPGFYFSEDPKTLETYGGGAGKVLSVYLRIERPTHGEMSPAQIEAFFGAIRVTKFPNGYDATQDHKLFKQRALEQPERAFSYLAETGFFKAYMDEDDVLAGLRAAGIDGVIIPVFGWNEYVAFDPRQIKSVDNRGTYDPTDPDILNGF